MKAKTKKRRKPLTDAYLNGLPLWKLLAIGLRDLEKQERAPRSAVAMGVWFVRGSVCKACLAGSVMRFSCRTRVKCGREFSEQHPQQRWVNALDDLRMGDVSCALMSLGRKRTQQAYSLDRIITYYEHNREAFWREMRQLQKDLKAADL